MLLTQFSLSWSSLFHNPAKSASWWLFLNLDSIWCLFQRSLIGIFQSFSKLLHAYLYACVYTSYTDLLQMCYLVEYSLVGIAAFQSRLHSWRLVLLCFQICLLEVHLPMLVLLSNWLLRSPLPLKNSWLNCLSQFDSILVKYLDQYSKKACYIIF